MRRPQVRLRILKKLPARLDAIAQDKGVAPGDRENIWQFTGNNALSNRIFLDADDPVDRCCDAWTKLEAQPWRIMSIGLRDWAHGF